MLNNRSARRQALRRITVSALGVAAVVPASAGAAALGTNGAATPTITWGACDAALLDRYPDQPDVQAAFRCGTALVPVDYRKPTGAKIAIAVSKLPATGPGTRLGSVFFNSGGPGARSRGTVTLGTAKLRQRFDLVGFDPRGTGSTSQPVRCASTAEEAAELVFPTFPIPGNTTQEATALTKVSKGAKGCAQRTPASTLEHISSANTARDLDLLRKAVGDAKLNYFSFSAGSIIGETYAQLFPSTTRALALDSPLDPRKYTTGLTTAEATQPLDQRMQSYVGTNQAVSSFLAACAASPDTCAFATPAGATAAQLRTKFTALLARVKAKNGVTIDTTDENGEPIKQTLSYQELVTTTFDELGFGIFTSQDIAGMLETVDIASKSSGARIPSNDLRDFLKVLLRRDTKPTDTSDAYNDNFYDAFAATVCADTNHPTSGQAYVNAARSADNEVPGFGPYWIWTTSVCSAWQVPNDVDRYTGPWTARPATPILFMSNKLGDTASHYANAVTGAQAVGARLVGVNTYGHTTYNLGSQCASDVVDNYLISLTVPPVGKTCDPDAGPFEPLSADEEASSDATVASSGGYARGIR